MVIRRCYLEGDSIWGRLWRLTGLNVSFEYMVITQLLAKTVCQEGKITPISFINHVNILFYFSLFFFFSAARMACGEVPGQGLNLHQSNARSLIHGISYFSLLISFYSMHGCLFVWFFFSPFTWLLLIYARLACLFFREAPAAYGRSQARGLIRAEAVGLCHSHSDLVSESHLQSTPQLTGMPDP